LTRNCSPSTVNALRNGRDLDVGDSAAIAAPSSVAEFKGVIDGGDRVLIDADSPWDSLPGSCSLFRQIKFTCYYIDWLLPDSTAFIMTLDLLSFFRIIRPSTKLEHPIRLNELGLSLTCDFQAVNQCGLRRTAC
jgi:hypothetical protein